jgi:hypothetical protein
MLRTFFAMNTILAGAVAASFAFAPAAFAAGEGHIDGDTMGFMLSPNGGKYYMGRLKSTVVNEALRNARPLPGGVAVIRQGGKFYVVDDARGTLYRMQMDVAGGN